MDLANENKLYISGKNVDDIVESLELALLSLFKSFKHNILKDNADKYHFLVSTDEEVNLTCEQFHHKKNSICEKPPRVNFDSELIFDQHISDLCRKASRKVNALARIRASMNLQKRRLLMNAFFQITVTITVCPLIWMCHSSRKVLKNYIHR